MPVFKTGAINRSATSPDIVCVVGGVRARTIHRSTGSREFRSRAEKSLPMDFSPAAGEFVLLQMIEMRIGGITPLVE